MFFRGTTIYIKNMCKSMFFDSKHALFIMRKYLCAKVYNKHIYITHRFFKYLKKIARAKWAAIYAAH